MKTKKSELDPFEYEDYGSVMGTWSIMVLVIMIAIIVLFGMLVLGGVSLISGLLK